MYIDETTKIILIVMAAGIWLNALNPWLEVTGAYLYTRRALKRVVLEILDEYQKHKILAATEAQAEQPRQAG